MKTINVPLHANPRNLWISYLQNLTTKIHFKVVKLKFKETPNCGLDVYSTHSLKEFSPCSDGISFRNRNDEVHARYKYVLINFPKIFNDINGIRFTFVVGDYYKLYGKIQDLYFSAEILDDDELYKELYKFIYESKMIKINYFLKSPYLIKLK